MSDKWQILIEYEPNIGAYVGVARKGTQIMEPAVTSICREECEEMLYARAKIFELMGDGTEEDTFH